MNMENKALLYAAPKWIELVLVLSAAWLVAGFVVDSSVDVNQKSLQVTISEGEVSSSLDPLFLRQVDLFGKSASKTVVSEQTIAPVVASRLNIKLVGTVVAGDKSAAMVTVGNSRKQNVFFLDEEIQSGVSLKAVEPTEIVVDNHGKRERISIEAGKTLARSAPAVVRRKSPASSAPTKVSKQLNRNHLQKQMRNFSTLLSQARVTPHFTNKKPDGFTISEIVKGSLYEEIGLQNGDVIHKVNGESVTSAEQAMRMYRELQSATFIDVEINRGGSIQQINYAIQ